MTINEIKSRKKILQEMIQESQATIRDKELNDELYVNELEHLVACQNDLIDLLEIEHTAVMLEKADKETMSKEFDIALKNQSATIIKQITFEIDNINIYQVEPFQHEPFYVVTHEDNDDIYQNYFCKDYDQAHEYMRDIIAKLIY